MGNSQDTLKNHGILGGTNTKHGKEIRNGSQAITKDTTQESTENKDQLVSQIDSSCVTNGDLDDMRHVDVQGLLDSDINPVDTSLCVTKSPSSTLDKLHDVVGNDSGFNINGSVCRKDDMELEEEVISRSNLSTSPNKCLVQPDVKDSGHILDKTPLYSRTEDGCVENELNTESMFDCGKTETMNSCDYALETMGSIDENISDTDHIGGTDYISDTRYICDINGTGQLNDVSNYTADTTVHNVRYVGDGTVRCVDEVNTVAMIYPGSVNDDDDVNVKSECIEGSDARREKLKEHEHNTENDEQEKLKEPRQACWTEEEKKEEEPGQTPGDDVECKAKKQRPIRERVKNESTEQELETTRIVGIDELTNYANSNENEHFNLKDVSCIEGSHDGEDQYDVNFHLKCRSSEVEFEASEINPNECLSEMCSKGNANQPQRQDAEHENKFKIKMRLHEIA